MYMLKRLLIFLLAFLGLAGFLLPMPAHASTIITFRDWHSSEHSVGRWIEMPTIYYYTYPSQPTDDSGDPSDIPLYLGVYNAKNQWSAALDVTIPISSTYSSSPFRFYAITRNQYNSLHLSNPVDATKFGRTLYTRRTLFENYMHGSYTIRGYVHHEIDCFVFCQSDFEDINYVKTITHEVGHGLGWDGHANHEDGETWVMVQGRSTNRIVQPLEGQHLRKVYDLYN